MNRYSTTWRVTYFAGVSAIVIFAVYGFAVFFLFQNIEQSALLSGEITEQTQTEEHLRLLKNNIQGTEEERAKIEARFVSEDGMVSFIEQVESLGEVSSSKVVLRSVSIEGEKNEALKLELSITGSFSEVFHFMALAEHLPFQVSFVKMSMLKLPKDTKSNEWEALATLTLHSFRGSAERVDKKTP
ncbi:MAG: hypothetical protein HYT28_00635 [Parcubacteria group bacterium]|nr:hypothetical protein [Parcubacteria group bacterium]